MADGGVDESVHDTNGAIALALTRCAEALHASLHASVNSTMASESSTTTGMITIPGSSSKIPLAVLQRGATGPQRSIRRMSRAQFEESFSLDEDGQIDGLDFVKVALEQIYYHMLDLSYESIKYGERDKGVEKHIRQCPERKPLEPLVEWIHNVWRDRVCSRFTSQRHEFCNEVFFEKCKIEGLQEQWEDQLYYMTGSSGEGRERLSEVVAFLGGEAKKMWTSRGSVPVYAFEHIYHVELLYFACSRIDTTLHNNRRQEVEWLGRGGHDELNPILIPPDLYVKILNDDGDEVEGGGGGAKTEGIWTQHWKRWEHYWDRQQDEHPVLHDNEWHKCYKYLYSHPRNVIEDVWFGAGDLLFADPDLENIKTRVRDAYRRLRVFRNFTPSPTWIRDVGGGHDEDSEIDEDSHDGDDGDDGDDGGDEDSENNEDSHEEDDEDDDDDEEGDGGSRRRRGRMRHADHRLLQANHEYENEPQPEYDDYENEPQPEYDNYEHDYEGWTGDHDGVDDYGY